MKRPGLTAVFLMGFLPAATVSAYVFNTGGRWSDNPYVIDVIAGPFQTHFGLDATRTMHMARSGLQAWLNVGVGFSTNLAFYNTTPSASDIEIEAKTCCDGDCTSGCLGRATNVPLSDNCALDIYKNTSRSHLYSDDRTATWDIQSILSHEFGHCLGLGHPSNPEEAIMKQGQYSHATYAKRFPRVDDKTGGQHAQYIADYPIRVRDRTGGAWTQVAKTSGSVGVATRADGWSLVAYETDPTRDTTSNVAHLAISATGGVSPECINWNEWTSDGVAVSEDTSGGFAKAFLAANDGGLILVYRSIHPALLGCITGTRTLTTMSSRRRPSLAYDAGTSRLVMTFIDRETGQLRISTSDSSGAWTTPTSLNTEWTDAPVGIDCGYWAPAGANRCFMAFPSADGNHILRIAEGYINAFGNYVHVGTYVTGGWTLNVAPDIQIINGNRLEIIHGATDNNRTAYMYVRDCSSGCTDTTYPLDQRTYVGGGISSTKLVTAAP
ncbi:matrixin family metalloprotease [Corallococcus soli]